MHEKLQFFSSLAEMTTLLSDNDLKSFLFQ